MQLNNDNTEEFIVTCKFNQLWLDRVISDDSSELTVWHTYVEFQLITIVACGSSMKNIIFL